MISLYRAERSWLHRLRAGHKLSALCLLSLVLLPIDTLLALLLASLVVLLTYYSLGRGGVAELKVLWPLWPWLLAMWVFHAFNGEPVLGLVVVVKMLLMIAWANLLTLSSRQSELLGALQVALTPITYLGFSTRPLAMAVSLMIRYIPVLLALFEQHQQAWRARGGGARGRWKLIVPALIAALQLAERAGESLSARGGVKGL